VGGLLVWAATLSVRAQSPVLNEAPVRPLAAAAGSLAAYAPADCGFFLQLERPEEINPILRDVNAWSLLQLVLRADSDRGPEAVDWYNVLVANLASDAGPALRELFSERAALIAPTWTRLSDGVIAVQVSSRAALRPLIGPGMVESERQEDALSIYESTRGLRIATDGRTVLIAQRQAPPDWFAQCLELLKGTTDDSLLLTGPFAAKVKELPRLVPQGFLYFAAEAVEAEPLPEPDAASEPATEPTAETPPPTTSAPSSQPAAENAPADEPTSAPAEAARATTAPARAAEVAPARAAGGDAFWPRLQAGAIGMYMRGGRVDFLIRASLAGPPADTGPRVDLTRLRHLPRSTLAVWATAVNVRAIVERYLAPARQTLLGIPAALLAQSANVDALRRDVLDKVGPRVMLAWGHDFLAEEGGSSLALIVESGDAEGVKRALDTTVHDFAAALNAAAGDEGEDLRVTTETIAGVEVTVVELADYFANAPANSVAQRLAATMRLSYAAVDGWLVVAWNLEHLRALIAAQQGTQPTLGEFTDVAALRPLRRGPTLLGIGQVSTAAAVMGSWLEQADGRPDSLLSVILGGVPDDAAGHGRLLGLGLGAQTRPGRVPVARVYQDGPCQGLLQSGDDIVAINGLTLALADSSADLRQQVEAYREEGAVTLRIEHEGSFADVEIVFDQPPDPRRAVVADAVRALRRVQAVGAHVAFATLAVNQSDADSFQAHLRFRFSESP
jgi:hypothetical protein